MRGRKPGEVADILYSGVLEGGAHKKNIEIIHSETEALQSTLNSALPGDLIVMFFENYAKVLPLLQGKQKTPNIDLWESFLSTDEHLMAIKNDFI